MTPRTKRCPRDHTCPSDRHDSHPRAYRRGCRSPATYDAVARRARERYHGRGPRMVDATGTARRIQALAALGWTYHEMATRLFVTVAAVHRRASHPPRTVHPDTADAIAALYLEISETPPVDDWIHQRAARRAQTRGHQPPEAWDGLDIDDPEAQPWTGRVRLAALGDPLALAALEARTTTWGQLTRADHDLVVDELRGRGRSHNDIAVHLDLHPDVVRSAWERVARRRQREQQRAQAGAA